MKRLSTTLIVCALLAACNPATSMPPDSPTNNQTPGPELPPIYAPRAGDEKLSRGGVFIDSADILTMESYPLQFAVLLKGNLPTPCHELRLVYNKPDSQNRINLEVYSVSDPNAICAQVLQSFEQNVYLGSYPSGHYTVLVNGEQLGEFDSSGLLQ